MKEISFRVLGFKAVHVSVTDTLAKLVESGDGDVQHAKLSVSREWLSLVIPALAGNLAGPLSYVPGNGQLTPAFDSLYPPAIWGTKVVSGARAARVIRDLLRWQLPRRGAGSPKREIGWDSDRDEFFALLLQYSDYGEPGKVTKALTDASADHRDLFERAFNGEDPIEAARQYYYRRMKEFKATPDLAIPLGRILSMRFEFENDI